MQKPTILFLVYTTFNPILAPGYYSRTSVQEVAIKPMGSGPWMFKEWKKDDHIIVHVMKDGANVRSSLPTGRRASTPARA